MTSPATPPAHHLDWQLYAEAIRGAEEAGHVFTGTERAELAAVAAGGDLEQRILTRASVIADSEGLPAYLARLRRAQRVGLALLMGAGALVGAAAAQSALMPDQDGLVNFYWALLLLLGVHSLAMLLWLLMLVLRGRLPPLTPLLSPLKGLIAAVAPAATGDLATRTRVTLFGLSSHGAIGRWGISSAVHSVWLATLAGTLAAMLLLLSARQFDFVWETTILPDRAFIALTDSLRPLPLAIGLDAPDPDTVLASRRSAEARPPAEARRQWSQLLIGSLIGVGIAPRALLLLLSVALLRRAESRLRLDLELPGYARLQHRLMPISRRIGVVDADPGRALLGSGDSAAGVLPPAQQMALLGIEIEPPSTGWPPIGIACARDLGIVADREAFAAALKSVAELQRAPLALLLVCSLATSPDRGIARRLRELRAVHRGPLAVLLTQQHRLRSRMSEPASAERVQDWRQIIAAAGIEPAHVVVLDLDDAEAMREFQLAQQGQLP